MYVYLALSHYRLGLENLLLVYLNTVMSVLGQCSKFINSPYLVVEKYFQPYDYKA